MVKQVVTAVVSDGGLSYERGAKKGARKMFYVEGRASIYVKGALNPDMYERLTLDLMRRVAAMGLPVSELRKVSK